MQQKHQHHHHHHHQHTADAWKDLAAKNGVSSEDFEEFLIYAAAFYGNMGNYLSFGDTKFIPNLPRESFVKIFAAISPEFETQCKKIVDIIYSLDPKVKQMGLESEGISSYYSPDIKRSEIDLVQQFMESIKMDSFNTRIFKTSESCFELKVASIQTREPEVHSFKGIKITIVYGDFSEQLRGLVENLKKALPYTENDIQKEILNCYIKHFETGDVKLHKDSQRAWVKDKGPSVETNIGFIETYRDPIGVRAEFEGFVAIVNKETTRTFTNLVENAAKFIALLPWGKLLEKETFVKPDYTAIECVAFATSGLPSGINLPNYDEIRQMEFKNVSITNVINVKDPNEKAIFIPPELKEFFVNWKTKSFEVQVGLHELLGHGSGKLLIEKESGLNFDLSNAPLDLDGKPASTWYKPGQSYETIFQGLANPFEECRAESVGVYLSTFPEILKIFGYDCDQGKVHDVTYANWMSMVKLGVIALEFYTPETKQWRQAHMQARHSILKTLIAAGQGLITIDKSGPEGFYIRLDRDKIISVGVPAMKEYLRKLQVYKATANVQSAQKMFGELTTLDAYWLEIREIVMQQRQPRRQYIQPVTRAVFASDGSLTDVELTTFETGARSMLESFEQRIFNM
eukprot:TRINITY_DN14675_c0_g1_i2.p1 TRINITY_DN14675_c0_g1~~TRINITY_DN14675_c0_g1_i2.p1  ORF type:complete len:700 (-),score=187.78 TRINITY_DN14675_c0_g1_i2:87-1973(-)